MDMAKILKELAKIDPDIEDAHFEEKFRACQAVYNGLGNYEDYTLEEFVDAQTFEKIWLWRKKS